MLNKNTSVDLEILTIEDDGSHLICSAEINGKSARILIDTGASRSVFDREMIRRFVNEDNIVQNEKLSTGLGTNSMPTSTIALQSFKIGELNLENFIAVILDLNHVNITYGSLGHATIDGVLGNDILLKYKAVIDYNKKILKLRLS